MNNEDLRKYFSDNGKKGQAATSKKYTKKQISKMRSEAAIKSHENRKKVIPNKVSKGLAKKSKI